MTITSVLSFIHRVKSKMEWFDCVILMKQAENVRLALPKTNVQLKKRKVN